MLAKIKRNVPRFPLFGAACIMLASSFSFALTSGPAMPEYNDFESVDNTDLVNLVTGDFAYTVPVMTVPGPGLGFPVVLGYHSNILAKQEASWVGLGWNLQAGAITRQVNNIPDDFKGDLVREELQTQRRHGWRASVSYDGVTVGISWDSETGNGGYVGYGFELGMITMTAGVGIGNDGIRPNVGASLSLPLLRTEGTSMGLSIGISSSDMNPVLGISASQKISGAVVSGGLSTAGGASISASLGKSGVSLSRSGLRGSFLGVSLSKQSMLGGNVESKSSAGFIPIPTPIGYFQVNWGTYETKLSGLAIDNYFGFLYSDAQGMGCPADNPATSIDERYKCSFTGINYGGTQPRVRKMEADNVEKPIRNSYGDFAYYSSPSEDIYSVATQGISGTVSPYRTEDGDYVGFLSKKRNHFQVTCDIPVIGTIGEVFGEKCDRTEELEFAPLFESGHLNEANLVAVKNLHGTAASERDNLVWRFSGESGGSLFTAPDGSRDAGFITSAGPRKIRPYYKDGKIEAWVITKEDGVQYFYTEPQFNYGTVTISSVERNGNKWTRQDQPGFAYAWLLTAIASPDFVRTRNDNAGCETYDGENGGPAQQLCLPENGDIGGWVRFTYGPKRKVFWESPYDAPAFGRQAMSYDYKFEPDRYVVTNGAKSVSYLSRIETPTHRADFAIDERMDGRPISGRDFAIGLAITYPTHWDVTAITGTNSTTLPRSQFSPTLARLNFITLFNKIENKEVSHVKFSYDYSLAKKTINSTDGLGKLTLLSLQQGATSRGPWLPPYVFSYGNNPDDRVSLTSGETQAFDAWGYRCDGCAEHYREADGSANAWNLAKITSPSGNTIEVTYQPKKIEYIENNPILFPKFYTYGNTFPDEYYVVKEDDGGLSGYVDFLDVKSMRQPIRSYLSNYHSVLLGQFEAKDYMNFNPIKAISLPRAPDKYLVEFPSLNTSFIRDPNLMPDMRADPNTLYMWVYNDQQSFEMDGFVDGTTSFCPGSEAIDGIRDLWNSYGLKNNGDGSIVEDPEFDNTAIGKVFSTLPYGTWIGDYARQDVGECNFITGHHRHRAVRVPYRLGGVVRVWALYNENTGFPANGFKYAGGSLVSQLKMTDPITGVANTVDYSYDDGATPVLPHSMSNYRVDFYHDANTGAPKFAGNPSVLYGKVTVKFNNKFTEDYHFITSQHAKNLFQVKPGLKKDGTALAGVDARLEVIDRTGLWGRLWKRESFDGDGEVVKTDITRWAQNWDFGADIFQSTFPAVSGGREVNGTSIEVADGTSNEKKYFGLTQKVFSNRQLGHDKFGFACSGYLPFNEYKNCLNDEGIFTTQVLTYSPSVYDYQTSTIQDHLTKQVDKKFHDYLTGMPLVTIQDYRFERGPQTGTEYLVGYKQLAYHQYPEMKAENMLSQEFSNISFQFGVNPHAYTLSQLTNEANVVKASFTKWADYSGKSGYKSFRQHQGFSLRDKTGFTLPTKNTSGGKGTIWARSTENTRYDGFGHVVEEKNPFNTYSSQILGQGQSLPVALAANARRDEIYQQSYETNEYFQELLPGFSNHARSGLRSRMGNNSLKVANCREKIGDVFVDKPECLVGAEYNRQATMVCFDLPPLPLGQTYVASAWYYDEFLGSNPDDPEDEIFRNKTTAVTRPGIFIGHDGGATGCLADNHPNGASHQEGSFTPGAANGDWNADQRAAGGKAWKRIWREFTPGMNCSVNSSDRLDNAILCLYASKGLPGSNVYYDEVRVRPKNSLMTSFAYDHRGNIIASADANEAVRQFKFDPFGNLSGTSNDDGTLISEQAKRNGDRNVTYSIRQPGKVIEECEVFELATHPTGLDSRFEFISVDGGATYTLKVDERGNQVSTLCYDPEDGPFNLKLFLPATGRIHPFTYVGGMKPPLVLQTMVEHAPNGLFPSSYDGKLYHMRGFDQGSLHFDGNIAFRLPTKAELVDRGKMTDSEVLKGYRIGFELLDLPNEYNQTVSAGESEVPTSDPNANLKYRMHLRYNYLNSNYANGGIEEIGKLGDVNRMLGRPNCFENPVGGCFSLVKYGEVKCDPIGAPVAEEICSAPMPKGHFSLRKTIDWPIENATRTLTRPLIENVSDPNSYYHGDFNSLWDTQYNFIFALYRHLNPSQGTPAYRWDWNLQALINIFPQNSLPPRPTTVRVKISPITSTP